MVSITLCLLAIAVLSCSACIFVLVRRIIHFSQVLSDLLVRNEDFEHCVIHCLQKNSSCLNAYNEAINHFNDTFGSLVHDSDYPEDVTSSDCVYDEQKLPFE